MGNSGPPGGRIGMPAHSRQCKTMISENLM
jgi:hypothetical protein